MFKFISNVLKNVGRAIASGVKKVAGFFARTFEEVQKNLLKGIKWVWNTKPVQWLWKSEPVQWIAKFMGPAFSWIWSVVSGPIGWVSATILAVFGVTVLPVVIAAVVVAVILGIVIWIVWANSGKPKDVMQPIRDATVDMGEKAYPVTKDETVEERYGTLKTELEQAAIDEDIKRYSEYFARVNFVYIREGGHPHLSKEKTRDSHILANTKSKAQAQGLDKGFKADWDWAAMEYGVYSESKRRREVLRLQREYGAEQARKAKAEKAKKTAKAAAKPMPVGTGFSPA